MGSQRAGLTSLVRCMPLPEWHALRVMLAQFDGYRVGRDLAATDLSRLAAANRGVPTRVRVAVDGQPEIARADPLVHDLFKLGRRLLLVHAARSL
jgi:hypothetical protein